MVSRVAFASIYVVASLGDDHSMLMQLRRGVKSNASNLDLGQAKKMKVLEKVLLRKNNVEREKVTTPEGFTTGLMHIPQSMPGQKSSEEASDIAC